MHLNAVFTLVPPAPAKYPVTPIYIYFISNYIYISTGYLEVPCYPQVPRYPEGVTGVTGYHKYPVARGVLEGF